MFQIKYLIKRNILLYLRNKSTVFFSLLSMIIIIGLYALFMADVNINSLLQYNYNRELATWLINAWIMGGIISVNAVNITLVLLINMVEDKDSNRLKDFVVAPLKRSQIIFGYLGASILVGIIMTSLSFIIAQIYILLNNGELLSLFSTFKILIGIIFSVISISSMCLFGLLFVKSEKTASTITTVVGTLIGFIAGVYVPIGAMPDFVQRIMKVFPISHIATMFKQLFVEKPSNLFFENTNELLEFNTFMGNVLYIRNTEITYFMILIFLTITSIIFFGLSLIKIKHDNK